MNYWIFQGKPSRYDIEKELIEGKTEEWTAYQYSSSMRAGDIVFFWRAAERERAKRGIYGWGEITASPREEAEQGCWVPVKYKKKFPSFLPFDELRTSPTFSTHQIFNFAIGTNFKLTHEQYQGLKKIIEEKIGSDYLPPEDA